jgi:hypothetical protein
MWRLFGAALIVLASRGPVMAADAILVVNQNLTQTLPAGGKTEISVLISSAQEISDAHVVIVQIRTPRGELLPVSLFTITQPPSRLTTAGAPFSLKLDDASRFKEAGDYTVTLRLTGMQDKAAQAQIVSLTLNVPVPVLDISRHQNATLSAPRWTPWSDVSVEETLRFEETSGRANVADLKVSAQDVFVKGTTDLAGASVQITGDTNGSNGQGQTLPANGQRDIHLRVTGLRQAGTMTTGLLLTSPTLATPIAVPLQIEVSDRWPIPFLVIFAGVLGGALVRHLSQVAQPRETARFRRSLLAAQVVRWRDRSRDIQQMQQLDAIDEILSRSDDRLQLNDVPGATALLDQAETAIAEFRKGWEQRFGGVLTRLRETAARLDELRDRIPDTEAADLARLETARQDLAAVQQVLSVFDVPLAESRIAAAAATLDALSAAHPPARRGLAPARARTIDIVIAEPPADRLAGQELSFQLDDPAAVIAAGDQVEWDFGDGVRLTTEALHARHRFLSAGAFRARVTVMRAGTDVAVAVGAIDVLPRPIEVLVERQRASLGRIAAVLTVVSLTIAVLTGLGLLFIGKSFGTPQQYGEAFLWGFGIDSGVKNVADLMKKVS